MVAQGWLLGLASIGNQAADQIDQEIGNTAVARMLNLRNILELVNHGLNDCAFSQKDTVNQSHGQMVLGVGFQLGDQEYTNCLMKKLLKRFRDVPFVPKDLSKQVSNQLRNRFSVVDIGGGQGDIEQFATIIDHQVQFEAKKPTRGSLSTCCEPIEDFMGSDSLVETHIQRGRIDEGDPCAAAQAGCFEVSTQWDQSGGNKVHKTGVTHQSREIAA